MFNEKLTSLSSPLSRRPSNVSQEDKASGLTITMVQGPTKPDTQVTQHRKTPTAMNTRPTRSLS